MHFRRLFALGLFSLLAASAVGGARREPESRGRVAIPAVRSAQDSDALAVRRAADISVPVVVRARDPRGAAGTGPGVPAPPANQLCSPNAHCAPVRLAAWRLSWAFAAHGGPLIIYPTAPPLHG